MSALLTFGCPSLPVVHRPPHVFDDPPSERLKISTVTFRHINSTWACKKTGPNHVQKKGYRLLGRPSLACLWCCCGYEMFPKASCEMLGTWDTTLCVLQQAHTHLPNLSFSVFTNVVLSSASECTHVFMADHAVAVAVGVTPTSGPGALRQTQHSNVLSIDNLSA